MWTNEENVVVKDRNKNAQRFLLIKNVGKIKNVKKRVFYFKIKNVKNVFNIYGFKVNDVYLKDNKSTSTQFQGQWRLSKKYKMNVDKVSRCVSSI